MPKTAVMDEMDVLEFARFSGPGTRVYPSPRPDSGVRDLVLRPMVWTQVDPAFRKSGQYVRDLKGKVFETVKAEGMPIDTDLSVSPDMASSLSPDQTEMVRIMVLDESDPIRPEFESALTIANQINQSTGFPNKDSLVTTAYLRERHRPFLMALADVEKRYRNRASLLSLIEKQLSLISTLPGK